MSSSLLVIVAAVLVAGPAFAFSLSSILGNSAGEPNFKLIHVLDLARLMDDHGFHVYVFDADPPAARESEGVIPGARVLSSYKAYDVATELPPDKDAKLVFYCHDVR